MDPPTDLQHHHLLHQEMASDETLESMLECRKSQQQDKKAKPAEETLKCPRCDSTNTKFCYYNNYSLTQPRYFCKSCRRYWTKGGTLRNIPVGGGCRKNNKRLSSSSSSSLSSSSKRAQDQAMISSPNVNYDNINLAISRLHQNQNQNQNPVIGQMGFGGELGYPILGNNPNKNLHDDGFGYFENPSINGYYNHQLFGGNIGHNENGGFIRNLELMNGSEEMGISSMAAYGGDLQEMGGGNCGFATTAIVKQESMCNDSEIKMLMPGFPWQFAGDQTGNMIDFEPAVKQNWTGFGSWHGLLNSPLM